MISTDDFMAMNSTRFNPESTGALIKQRFDAVAESAMPRCRDGSTTDPATVNEPGRETEAPPVNNP